jgi:hypothetical protein
METKSELLHISLILKLYVLSDLFALLLVGRREDPVMQSSMKITKYFFPKIFSKF